MKSINNWMLFLLIFLLPFSCKSIDTNGKSDKYNFKFSGYDENIIDPGNDRRSYYKIYIDKIEEGRTTTGLESQEKSFDARLSQNKHLLVVEKWVLDEKSGTYVKLNNIDQPKPRFFYFTISKNKTVEVKLKVEKDGKAEFRVNND